MCPKDIISPYKKMSKKQATYFYLASLNAKKSTMIKKHGAVIVYNNKVIGKGNNYPITYMEHRYGIHAEQSAINDVIKTGNKHLLSKSSMYVVRIGNNYDINTFRQSVPCENCKRLINEYSISKVYFSTQND